MTWLTQQPATPSPPRDPPRSVITRGDQIVADHVVARIERTPLTAEERASPMSWDAMASMLMDFDFDAFEPLGELWDTVCGEDALTVNSDQTVARAYPHVGADGERELWVSIEYQPWIVFTRPVHDDDGDGVAEVYARVVPTLISDAVMERIVSYHTDILSTADVRRIVYDDIPMDLSGRHVYSAEMAYDQDHRREALSEGLGPLAWVLDEECLCAPFVSLRGPSRRFFFVVLVDGVPGGSEDGE